VAFVEPREKSPEAAKLPPENETSMFFDSRDNEAQETFPAEVSDPARAKVICGAETSITPNATSADAVYVPLLGSDTASPEGTVPPHDSAEAKSPPLDGNSTASAQTAKPMENANEKRNTDFIFTSFLH
jgi:hypothetical protein